MSLVPPEGGMGSPGQEGGHLRASPQLLRQLTSPTVGGSGLVNHTLEAMLPRSPLPQASYHTPMSPYRPVSPTSYQGGSPGKVPMSRTANQRSPATSPARKRLKLDLDVPHSTPVTIKRKLFEWRTSRLRRVTTSYRDNMAELFFLQNGTNVTDNLAFFRKKPTQAFGNFLKISSSPARVISEVETAVVGQTNNLPSLSSPSQPPIRRPPISYSPRITGVLSPVKVGEQLDVFNIRMTSRPSTVSNIPPPSVPVLSRDQISERMKQEGWVTRRVSELTRDGLWPVKRLPKVAERPRPLSAWDLVLEEMKWLAADFHQERQWKKAAARVQSAAAREQFLQQVREQEQAQIALKNGGKKIHIAKQIASRVEKFWTEVKSLHHFEEVQRTDIYAREGLSQQTGVVEFDLASSSIQGVKRKLGQRSDKSVFCVEENGLVSDNESTISDQEAWESLNLVDSDEIQDLELNSVIPLEKVIRDSYSGYKENLCEISDTDSLSDWEMDSDCESLAPVNFDCLLRLDERTDNEGSNLSEMSVKANSLLPKPVINSQQEDEVTDTLLGGVLKNHQQVAVKWLLSLHSHHLPAVLADEAGMGRKVTIAAFLSRITLQNDVSPPHLIVCPLSSLSRWTSVLSHWVPSLNFVSYSGDSQDRRQLRDEIFLSDRPPRVVLASYRNLFLDSNWFLTRSWSILVLADSHNVISAGSSDQIQTLANLKSRHKVLLCSKPHKENPIDLWNTIHLMFPSILRKKEEINIDMEVEGTTEYKESVVRLQTILSGFILSRSKARYGQGSDQKVWVNLGKKRRKLYDDFLAQPSSQECIQRGDLISVSGLIQSLRDICNPPCQEPEPDPEPTSLPSWCYLSKDPPRPFRAPLVQYDPLNNISLDQVNLVFLSQELTTTVLTSSRLRALKASRELIAELPSQNDVKQPHVPRGKLNFSLEAITRGLGGWAVGGLTEGASLVRTANGQVCKVSSTPKDEISNEVGISVSCNPEAFHPESLDIIASVNRWRCDGFPLYGQDLIRSLSIMPSLRPVRSRFRGQGYVNCLNTTDEYRGSLESGRWRGTGQDLGNLLKTAEDYQGACEPGRWRYTSPNLGSLCSLSKTSGEQIQATTKIKRLQFNNKMQSLRKLLLRFARKEKKVVVVVRTLEAAELVQKMGLEISIRSVTVGGSDNLTTQSSLVEDWSLEPRLPLLLLAGFNESQGGRLLDLSPASNMILLESGPGLWAPVVSSRMTIHRLVTRGTLEEGLGRVSNVRKILADIDLSNSDMESVRLGKQTLQEVLLPQPDNGFIGWHINTKKKEKGLSDSECISNLSAVWNYLTGTSGLPSEDLLDLADLETSSCFRQSGHIDLAEVRLHQWLATIDPMERYGMRLLRENWEVREGLSTKTETDIPLEEKKTEWEKKRIEEDQIKSEIIITFESHLADRDWRSEDDELVSLVLLPPVMDCEERVVSPVGGGLYSKETIPDHDLPPIHVKKEKKVATSGAPLGVVCQPMSPPSSTTLNQLSPVSSLDLKPKIKREQEQLLTTAPRSLFDRPKPLKALPRRPGGVIPGGPNFLSTGTSNSPTLGTPQAASGPILATKPPTTFRDSDAGPEWSIQEDWVLHQAVMAVQELPLSLSSASPGHTTNWDMVSDMVNAVSRCFRSVKQCRVRYEITLVPREEGRIMYEVTPKKVKKITKLGVQKGDKKGVTTLPSRQPMKTGALFKADNNNAFSSLFSGRFETIKSIANKRTPTTKPLLVNPTMRNPKHAAVLAESGISYDAPLTPVQVAANRAERIQREKQRTAAQAQLAPTAVTGQPALPQTPLAQQSTGVVRSSVAPSLSGLTPTVTAVNLPTAPAQAVVVGISQPVQGQQTASAVVQNTGNITRPLQQTVTALSVQDILKGTVTTTVVSGNNQTSLGQTTTARLTTGQVVQVTQAVGKSAASPTVQVAGRQLTQQQLQVLKQQALLKRNQQEQQIKQRLPMTGVHQPSQSTSKVSVSGTALGGGRGQVLRQNVRSMTEPEMKALLAKQQLKVGSGGVVQVPAGTSLSSAQLQQLGIQVANPSSSAATIVKTITTSTQAGVAGSSKSVTIAGVTGAVNIGSGGQLKAVTAGRGTPISGSPQQLQQLQLQRSHLQLIQKKNVAGTQRVALQQVSGGKGLPAQLIVQQPGKGLPATVTVQQLQQIVKSVAGGGQGQVVGAVTGGQQQIISHAVLSKPGAPGQTVQARVIPVTGSGARPGQQTIQVVSAGQRSGAPNVTIDQLGRPQANALASALAAGNHVKIQAPTGASQQQIISHVSAALAGHAAGQNVSVAVRTPPATTVLQSTSGQPRQQGGQMVNLQLSVAQPQSTQTSSNSQSNNTAE